jgi:hypothetical protein
MRVQAAKGQSSHLQWNDLNILISTHLKLIQNLKNLRIIAIHPLWNIFGCNTKMSLKDPKLNVVNFPFDYIVGKSFGFNKWMICFNPSMIYVYVVTLPIACPQYSLFDNLAESFVCIILIRSTFFKCLRCWLQCFPHTKMSYNHMKTILVYGWRLEFIMA